MQNLAQFGEFLGFSGKLTNRPTLQKSGLFSGFLKIWRDFRGFGEYFQGFFFICYKKA